MNSKGHLLISLLKSGIRCIACTTSLIRKSATPLAVGFLVAEMLGVAEELVDKR